MPNDATNLTVIVRDLTARLRLAAQESANSIREGGDNPAIKRINQQSFVVSSSELFKLQPSAGTETAKNTAPSSNWSPFFHDWKSQYERLADMLEKEQFAAVRGILETGKHGGGHGAEIYAKEVVDHARAILGDMQFSLEGKEEATPGRRVRPFR